MKLLLVVFVLLFTVSRSRARVLPDLREWPRNTNQESSFSSMFPRRPICGEFDPMPKGRAYSASSMTYKRDKPTVTWSLIKPSYKLSVDAVRSAMWEAFQIWSTVIPVDFVEVSSDTQQLADIMISFERWNHGIHGAFDGPCRIENGGQYGGGVLAHAAYPPGNFIHFDDDELWTYKDPTKLREGAPCATDFLAVAVHEIGHSLGLFHNNRSDSIMYPSLQPPQFTDDGRLRTIELTREDVRDIQEKYGPRITAPNPTRHPHRRTTTTVPVLPTRPPPTYPPRPTAVIPTDPLTPIPDVSFDGVCPRFRAAVTAVDNSVYFFHEATVWRKRSLEAPTACRYLTRQLFPSAPRTVTAAFTSTIGRLTFLFHGRKAYAYSLDPSTNAFQLESGYPKDVPVLFEPHGAFRADNGVLILHDGNRFAIWDNNWNQIVFQADLNEYFPQLPHGVTISVGDQLYILRSHHFDIYDLKFRSPVDSKPLNELIVCSCDPMESLISGSRSSRSVYIYHLLTCDHALSSSY